MDTPTFTPAERLLLLQYLRTIYHNENLRPSTEEAHRMRDLLHQLLDGGEASHAGSLRDEFGNNRLLLALEACMLAASEIGLRGDIFLPYLLFSVTPSPDAVTPSLHLPPAFLTTIRQLQATTRLAQATKMEAMKTDNFRNLFVSQAADMRVVLLLIAQCAAIMRRIKDTPNTAAQKAVSTLAADLYAPLAHKLGLYQIKSELEDLSLKYLEHDAYYMIKDNLNATKRSRDAYIERFTAPIRSMLDAEGLRYHMKGRTKSIHSIWQKMKKQQCGFHGVYDLFAIRIIIDAPLQKEKEQCWKVFSLITNRYESNLKRLRDWISVPKSNGYESLHITVKGPEDKWVEVQIRTERMDEVAEHGLAAHWRYKGIKSSGGGVDAWLADIRQALETGNDRLLTERLSSKSDTADIYVFTPKGDLYRLPPGATVLDFAYHIHSNIGNHCIGGKMNGRNVSIRQPLESGATVEIQTAATQTPKQEWLNIAVSSHAKAKIRSAVRDLQAREGILARELLERKLKNRKIEWDESLINQLIKKSGFKESTEFYKAIAEGKLDVAALTARYQELARWEEGNAERATPRSADEFVMGQETPHSHGEGADVLLIDQNVKGIDFQMARCCQPVYGDDVFGFVTTGGGIKIHRHDCPNAPALKSRFSYRIVPARWAGKGAGKYPVTLHVVGTDDLGVVNNITSIISKENHILLRNINIDAHDGLFSGILTVMVDDNQVVNGLLKKLRTVKGVKAISRS